MSCPMSVFNHLRNIFWELTLYVSTALSFVEKQMNSDRIWNFYLIFYSAEKTKSCIYEIFQIQIQHIYSEAHGQ